VNVHLLWYIPAQIVTRVGLYEAWQLPLTLLALLTAALITKYPIGLFAKFETLVGRIADRPYLSATLIAAVATCARLALSPFLGTPEPIVPDEVSLIFQAETYLTGHLANHVNLLPNFASLFVILSPTYASMYPVLRSFPMFLGLILGIGAWGGVLLTMVALTVATYWMVREWINAKYAFIAAFIVIIRFGLFSLWVNSYWGGAFTALGGVLLLGGFKAVRSRPNLRSGALVGLGVVILMTTRPYEGAAYAAPFGAALIIRFIRSRGPERKSLIPAGLAAAALVVAGFGLTFADNQATTGDWKLSPYFLYRQELQMPAFLFEGNAREPHPRYPEQQASLEVDKGFYIRRATWARILSEEDYRFRSYWDFYVGFALLIPFVLGLYALRREPTLLLAGASLCVALSLLTYDLAHYAAPAFGLAILATMTGFQSLRQWWPRGYPYGLSLSRALPLALLLGSVMPLRIVLLGSPPLIYGVDFPIATSCCWLRPRSFHMTVASELDRYEGKKLVIVAGGPNAPKGEDLVANDPDIDNEKTIWMNDDPEFNQLAIDRYRDRRIWRLGWLDDHAACLQLFQNVSSPADALPDIGRHSGDQKPGWVPGSPDRCPGGLVHPQFIELN
jgi:hypothetical protein